MIQQIDFFREIIQKRNITLSFNTMKNIVYGLFFCTLSFTVILMIIQYKSEHDLKKLEEKQSQTTAQLQTKESKLPPKASRDQVIAELNDVQKVYEKNQKILNELTKINKNGSAGFSNYLLDLAHSVPKGLWLTKLEFQTGGSQFSIMGKTMRPEYVTAFIEALHGANSFSGKTLKILDLSDEGEKPVLTFTIQTEKFMGKQQ